MEDRKLPAAPRRRCLVFGGSGALGRAVCEALADAGARVVFTWFRGKERAAELVARLPDGLALQVDVLHVAEIEAAVNRAVEALGGIDAMVHCIGIGVAVECQGSASRHRMSEIDEGAWDKMMNVNLRSAYFACRRASQVMHGGGELLLVGSIDAVKPVPSPVHYAASKGGLAVMAQAMSKEVGDANIRVNVVAPGILEEGLSRLLPANLIDEYRKHCGLKRLGRLQEAAALIAWFALHNTYISGRTIALDGGL